MSKIIGIPGWVIEGKYFGVGVSYANFISQFGRMRVLTPEDTVNPPKLDLLILPGGADINPVTYGEIGRAHV